MMGSALRVARILGVDIRLHPAFLLIVAFFVVDGLRAGPGGMVDALGWLGLLFGSVLVHELAHAVVGRARGARVRDIVLLPIGGATRTERFPDRPMDEFVMTAVGPASSFVLAALGAVAAVATGTKLLPIDLHHGSVLARLVWLNLILGGFNLLPAFPMDGGRLLRAVLSMRTDRLEATRRAARIGQFFAVAMGLVGLYVNIWLIVIAVFVYFGAGAEVRIVEVEARLSPFRVRDAMTAPIPQVDALASAVDVARRAMLGRWDAVAVVIDGRLGVASAGQIVAAARAGRNTVGSIVRYDLPRVDPEDHLDRALETMQASGTPVLPVVERGTLVGVLTVEDVERFAA